MSLEFGKKGSEGIKREGIFENNGLDAVGSVPFRGNLADTDRDRITAKAERIQSITEMQLDDLEASNPDKNAQTLDNTSEIAGREQDQERELSAEEINEETKRQIESLKKNLDGIFGRS